MLKPPTQKEVYDLRRVGVKAIMRALERDGFRVERADSTGFTTPGRLEVDRPDVIARRGGSPDQAPGTADGELFAFGVVRTADEVDSDRSHAQLLELGSRVMKESQDLCPLYVGVPADDVEVVRAALRALGIGSLPNVKLVSFRGSTDSTPTTPPRRGGGR